MYDNDMNFVRYPVGNGMPGNDYYNSPAEDYSYPSMPCPDYPAMPGPVYPPMPPINPMPPMPPMPIPPAPPIDPMPGMRFQCLMQLKNMLEKMKKKKVALVIEGTRGRYDCAKIMDVDDCTVVVDTRNDVCVIPLREIKAVCMSKEVAKEILGDYK